MGRVAGGGSLISFEKTAPGDFTVFSMDQRRACGIVLELNEDQDVLIGLIEGGYDVPQVTWRPGRDKCVSFGSSWVIDPVGVSIATVGEEAPRRRAGVLALASHGWLISFATSHVDPFGRFSCEWRSVKTLKKVDRSGTAMFFDEWRLWTDEAERVLPGAKPLLSYRAQEQKGRSET